MQYLLILLILIFAVTSLAIPQSFSQTDPNTVPGGLLPDDDMICPVGNVDAVSVNPDGLASGDYAFWIIVYDEHDYEREPFAVRVR